MRNYLLYLVLVILSSISARAQLIQPFSSYNDGLSLGLEKNRSFYIEYGNNGFEYRLKHSITADKIRYQYWRIEGGYTYRTNLIDLTCDLFYSSDWHLEGYNVGTQVSVICNFFDQYGNIAFRYVPFYDKELKFNHGWSISGKLKIVEEISLVAEYGSIPDFRISYNRLYLGTIFNVHTLSVYPMLEIPLYENEVRLSHSHVVVSLSYTFGECFRKKNKNSLYKEPKR